MSIAWQTLCDGAADRRQLDQDLGTVPALLHHGLDPLQVADGPGQTVDHRPGLGVAVGMAVAVFVGPTSPTPDP